MSEPAENSAKKDASDQEESVRQEAVRLDETLKLLFEVSKDLLVKTLNSLFNEDFDVDSIEIGKTETEIVTDDLDILRADINIKITEHKPNHYHIELQTEVDGDMGFRSFRYDVLQAMSNYVLEGKKTGRALMPKSIIIQIKSGKKLPPDYGCFELEMADGSVMKYSASVLNYSDYDKGRLLKENLYILLPLQVFMLRDKLDRLTKSGEPEVMQAAILKAKTLTENLIKEVNKLHKEGEISLYDKEKILIALKELFGHLNDRYNSVNSEELNREVDVMVRTYIIDENMRKRLDRLEQAEREKAQALQALENERTDRAREMLVDNEPISKIIKYTKLTETQILNIKGIIEATD